MNASTTPQILNGSTAIELSEKDRILVKYSFANPSRIPAGIRQVPRNADMEQDKIHATWAVQHGQAELAEVGRIREGRVDTGVQAVNNAQMLQVATLRRALFNNGFGLADCYWQEREKQGGGIICLVVLEFQRISTGMVTPPLPRQTVEALRVLANTPARYCHVWSNPDDSITVNCISPQFGQKPKTAMVVRDGQLVAIEVTAVVEESEE
jgi:hypothetical protein